MLDSHFHPINWGLRPILFSLGPYVISSYTFFVILALITGSLIYYREARKIKSDNEHTFFIAIAALIGGAIGSKIPVWLSYASFVSSSTFDAILSGKTIIGGFIGGALAVTILKKYLKIKGKKGNLFAPSIALGVAVGRVGCLLQGCCYGIATNLPWGINFGDGIKRHPTQIYEILFSLLMFFYLQKAKKRQPAPGALLKTYFLSYFIFRFFLEFIKYEPKMLFNLTIYQYLTFFAILYLNRVYFFSLIFNNNGKLLQQPNKKNF